MIYIEMTHGRHHPDEELEDWGFDGPVLGPFPFFHQTYLSTINIGGGPSGDIVIEGDMIKFMDGYYGDISVLSNLDNSELKARWKRTQAIVTNTPDAVTLIGHQDEWVRHYARTKLAKGENNA